MSAVLDVALAERILSIVDVGLCHGVGEPTPGKMCVEAAICFALGEPHGDRPSCVAEPDCTFKVRLNDALAWSSCAARAKGLRLLAIAQLGTNSMDRRPWVNALAEQTIRRVVPAVLRIAAERNQAHAESLEAAALRCEREGTREAARAAKNTASAVASADAYASAAAADDASAASASSASAASAASAYASAAAADDERLLMLSADCALEAYRLTGSPGYDLLVSMGMAAVRAEEEKSGD